MFVKKPKSLDNILGSFQKTLTDLQDLIAGNDTLCEGHYAEIERRTDEALRLQEETGQAQRVAARIKELVA